MVGLHLCILNIYGQCSFFNNLLNIAACCITSVFTVCRDRSEYDNDVPYRLPEIPNHLAEKMDLLSAKKSDNH